MSKPLKVAITPEKFAAKAAQLKGAQGIELTGNAGTISRDGVTATYSYDGVGELTVEVTHKPLIYPQSVVESKLTEWLSS